MLVVVAVSLADTAHSFNSLHQNNVISLDCAAKMRSCRNGDLPVRNNNHVTLVIILRLLQIRAFKLTAMCQPSMPYLILTLALLIQSKVACLNILLNDNYNVI